MDYHKIVIVGAGMAGLGAATKLTQNGVEDFLVLEAQDQAGGRIKTVYIDQTPLDLGAQWMHGKSNSLYKLAADNNLLADEVSEEGLGQYIRSNGDIVDPFTVKFVAFKIGQILEDCAKLVSSNEPVLSLGFYLEDRFTKYLNEEVQDIKEHEIYKELYDWHVKFQIIDNSCTDLSRLSARRWGDYVCPDDEAHSNLKYGYQSLVSTIIDALPNNCIEYNTEVVRIQIIEKSRVQIDLKNGKIIVCDHLILTPSLGVLKEFDGLSNILPEKVLTNIRNMGFASICKIFLFYDKKWWGDLKGFQLLWMRDCNFSEKHSWLRQITGFDEVFNHDTALITWVGGESVKEVEALDTDVIGKQCTNLLQKFLLNHTVPLPKRVIRTQWLSNPFVKGSYCHITPECDAPGTGIGALAEPVTIDEIPRIILAGEAVHASHYSTTHGAYESGLDQAQVLCDFLANNDSQKV